MHTEPDGQRYIRIAFCGAGGTGKTSTAKMLIEGKDNWYFAPSVARATFKQLGYEREDDQLNMTEEQKGALQGLLWDNRLIAEREFNKVNRNLVYDRSTLDQIAYRLMYCPRVWDEAQYETELYRMVKESLAAIDILYYFPLVTYGDAAEDGMRDNNYGQRFAHDVLIRGLLSKYGPEPQVIKDISQLGRKSFVLRAMSKGDSISERVATIEQDIWMFWSQVGGEQEKTKK